MAEVGVGESLRNWMVDHVRGAAPPFSAATIAGGHSNITLRLIDASGVQYAVRRPPSGEPDRGPIVAREFRFLQALHPTGFPVPMPIALCTDTVVMGTPFLVSEWVEGHVVRNFDDACSLAEPVRSRAADSLVATLGRLHAVDPSEVGLADIGRGVAYTARQIQRWRRQVDVQEHELVDELQHVGEELACGVPSDDVATLIHGDFHFANTVIADDGSVRAVLDWELATIGHPLADLAVTLAQWPEADEDGATERPGPTSAPGFPRRDHVVARYAEQTGRDMHDLPFFLAFAHWRAACIGVLVVRRYRDGHMATPADIAQLEQSTRFHFDQATKAFDALR